MFMCLCVILRLYRLFVFICFDCSHLCIVLLIQFCFRLICLPTGVYVVVLFFFVYFFERMDNGYNRASLSAFGHSCLEVLMFLHGCLHLLVLMLTFVCIFQFSCIFARSFNLGISSLHAYSRFCVYAAILCTSETSESFCTLHLRSGTVCILGSCWRSRGEPVCCTASVILGPV